MTVLEVLERRFNPVQLKGYKKGFFDENEEKLFAYTILKQMFEWIKPRVHEVPGHHAEWILEDIKDIPSWKDEFDFHEPSVTMEDTFFWSEHVFKKQKEAYLYLEEQTVFQ